MTKRFKLSVRARTDLDDISAYTISAWGASQEVRYMAELEARLDLLARRSKLGRERAELSAGVRSFGAASHVIYYRITDYGIVVARILHQRQDPKRHL